MRTNNLYQKFKVNHPIFYHKDYPKFSSMKTHSTTLKNNLHQFLLILSFLLRFSLMGFRLMRKFIKKRLVSSKTQDGSQKWRIINNR